MKISRIQVISRDFLKIRNKLLIFSWFTTKDINMKTYNVEIKNIVFTNDSKISIENNVVIIKNCYVPQNGSINISELPENFITYTKLINS